MILSVPHSTSGRPRKGGAIRTPASAGLSADATVRGTAVTLAADLVSNTLYYALIGLGRRRPLLCGAALGALAGAGAVALPGRLGLSQDAPLEG